MRITKPVGLRNKSVNKLLSVSGVTYIELILYVAIVGVLLGTLIPFALNVIGGGVKSATQQEVFSQARYISERLKYEIRSATAVGTSNFDVNLATDITRQLSVTNPTNGTTIIKVTAAGNVTIQQGAGAAVNINSNDTKVTDLTFTNYSSSDLKTKHIGFTLSVESDYTGSQQQYSETISLRSGSEMRSN